MKITVLLENTKLKNSDLTVEHGISLFIEKNGYKILFDTGGPQGSAMKNATKLGIDLSRVDAVVISHGHNDHTGGLLKFFQINDKAPVYLKKEALCSYYSKRPDGNKYIGIDTRITERYLKRLHFVDKALKLSSNIFIVPHIHKEFPIPYSNRVLFEKINGKFVRDDFNHELFMVIENNNGLTIFSGCGHSGIKNIINTAKEVFPGKNISTVIGGFHLQAGVNTFAAAKKEEIEEMAEWISLEGIDNVYTGHCTGERGFELMIPILKDKLKKIYTGMKIIK
ncbi:MBL fold metallo-hydrolase [Methanobacterium sp.]|uniref:MBL fold metallo-hydrolase n=1 Tax=Methanobacterium sp. TaxID=2164 RepID=UPI003C75C873